MSQTLTIVKIAIRANYDYWDAISEEEEGHPLYFKPADIESLAAKINETAEQPDSAQVKSLKQQLEDEKHAREAAEDELLKRRTEDGNRGLAGIRNMLMHDHVEFKAMQERAEQAERMVASLDRQLTEQAERKRINDNLIKALAEEVRKLRGREGTPSPHDESVTGLTFPYATKQLEAMRDAALAHWVDHDRSKPAPYGIQKEVSKFLATRTGENARKLAELAAAIKPDNLPKA